MANEDKRYNLIECINECINCDLECEYKYNVKELKSFAEWKDKQFIELLYEWMYNGKIDVMNIEDLIKEINGENK